MPQANTQSRSKRNYRREYDSYQGKPEQIKRRAMRNAARREYEETHGDQSSKVDIDHRKPIVKGGRNDPDNLRAVDRNINRSFRRTKRAGMR